MKRFTFIIAALVVMVGLLVTDGVNAKGKTGGGAKIGGGSHAKIGGGSHAKIGGGSHAKIGGSHLQANHAKMGGGSHAKIGGGSHPQANHAKMGGGKGGQGKANSNHSGGKSQSNSGFARNRNYNNWGGFCWFPNADAYGYYSSEDDAWYYWYQPTEVYLPIDYMQAYPPVNEGNMNISMQNNNPPLLPPNALPVK